jgi:hypothetical protein
MCKRKIRRPRWDLTCETDTSDKHLHMERLGRCTHINTIYVVALVQSRARRYLDMNNKIFDFMQKRQLLESQEVGLRRYMLVLTSAIEVHVLYISALGGCLIRTNFILGKSVYCMRLGR